MAQLSIIEKEREINANSIQTHLPENKSNVPIIYNDQSKEDLSEREILYKVLFDMKNDITELKKITYNLMIDSPEKSIEKNNLKVFSEIEENPKEFKNKENTIEIQESLSLIDQEKNLIIKALNKHKDRRKDAAKELGISERTLYRKLKEFEL